MKNLLKSYEVMFKSFSELAVAAYFLGANKNF